MYLTFDRLLLLLWEDCDRITFMHVSRCTHDFSSGTLFPWHTYPHCGAFTFCKCNMTSHLLTSVSPTYILHLVWVPVCVGRQICCQPWAYLVWFPPPDSWCGTVGRMWQRLQVSAAIERKLWGHSGIKKKTMGESVVHVSWACKIISLRYLYCKNRD